jgi:hypothetical protein
MKAFTVRYFERPRNPAAIGLFNLIYNSRRIEEILRLKCRPQQAAWKAKIKMRNNRILNSDKETNVVKIQT